MTVVIDANFDAIVIKKSLLLWSLSYNLILCIPI